jgi:hypothetical protein
VYVGVGVWVGTGVWVGIGARYRVQGAGCRMYKQYQRGLTQESPVSNRTLGNRMPASPNQSGRLKVVRCKS